MGENGNAGAGRTGEILRFAVTGGFCALIEMAVLILLRDKAGLDTLAAVPIAFLVSVIVNYMICVAWVFRGAKDGGTAAKLGFLVTSLIGLGLNELLMWLFRMAFGEDQTVVTVFGFAVTMYMVNKALATLLVMIWNYFTKRAVLKSSLMRRRTRAGRDGERS